MTHAALSFRLARESDLPVLVALLVDDPLGATRERLEDPLPASYHAAFQAIRDDPNQGLLLAQNGSEVVGMLQLTFIPSLTYQGSWRAQIEGVRVAGTARSRGVGRQLVEEAVRRAAQRGCRMVQLTTDKRRPRAIAFYRDLGFTPTHEGMKLHLD
ncbi:MAG TPA: GNAT family N-acetyltransferase [Longimicrobiales bacterium]|nr:GNAT family N-acetyltransferase [Longimicrobiales bacterium]